MKVENAGALSEASKQLLLKIARDAITAHLEKRPPTQFKIEDRELLRNQGAFVTLHKEKQLRGCIGHVISYQPLYKTVAEVAVAAATRDPRFPPLALEETPAIELEISVLSPLERVGRIEEIEVGVHGLYLKRGDKSGLLLPQVAVEYGWNREQFLEHTCKKAWLEKDAWRDAKTEIYRFSASIFSETLEASK
jgi:AmmeMemoRadiSam system protein A